MGGGEGMEQDGEGPAWTGPCVACTSTSCQVQSPEGDTWYLQHERTFVGQRSEGAVWDRPPREVMDLTAASRPEHTRHP